MRTLCLLLLILTAFGISGCHRKIEKPRPRMILSVSPPAAPIRVLILYEPGRGIAEAARELETLITHFDERCAVTPASKYERKMLANYPYVFYFAGETAAQARARFARDFAAYGGATVWVGPGLSALGKSSLDRLGLAGDDLAEEPSQWVLSYNSQQHAEQLAIPALHYRPHSAVLATAFRQSGTVRRPFLVGTGKLWYVACGPASGRGHFWSKCVWADVLHEILASRHPVKRRIVPVLRDVPVWVNDLQAPRAVRPLLAAGIPITVLAHTRNEETLLSDRPAAVRGLRQAESLGAVITLAGKAQDRVREQLHLAWEVGIHPLAWQGPTREENPFRLRIANADDSPPFHAGGLLPSPINLSDAGYIAAEDAAKLRMLVAVRDGIALVSLGLWAPSMPFSRFLQGQQANGWELADLRELRGLVTDSRRIVASSGATILLPANMRFRRTVLGPRWRIESEKFVTFSESQPVELRVSASERSVVVLEPVRQLPGRPFLTGVTLDPWSYSGTGISAETLAQALSERFSRNGVNTVFFYAYNVEEGAAYRTRYRGASISDWGHQDLLGHLLEACRARGVRVVAWLYSGRDRGMWLRHPEWRERTAEGKEYNPLRLHATYFLCPRRPEVRTWYAGLVRDLAHRYPTLDGVELCEPLVNWWGDQACHCEFCRREFASAHPGEPSGGPAWRRFRAQGLTEFLSQCLQAISREGVDTYVMTISDAWSNGAILSPERQTEESGFDLNAILDGPHPPDWVNFEVIWQQWAAIYGTEVFNPAWAAETAQQLVRRIAGRSRVILHVELTDFGSQHMTPAKIAETITRVSAANPQGIECYHSAALDAKAAWSVIKRSFEGLR